MSVATINVGKQRPINIDILREFVGDDPDVLTHFLSRFLEALRKGILKMQGMALLQQWSEASALAHSLKTSALAIGAFHFAALCGSMEKLGLMPNDASHGIESDSRKILIQEMGLTFKEVEKAVNAILPLAMPLRKTDES